MREGLLKSLLQEMSSFFCLKESIRCRVLLL
jgi:hypothetical protein